MITFKRALLAGALATTLAGCADEPATTPEALGPSTGTCPTGKCDGLAETVKDYYDDMRSVDLDDLTSLGMGLATDQLNDALGAVPYLDVELEPTAFYGAPRALFDQVVVHDLKGLTAGLTARLGANAFATRVNALRQATLDQGEHSVFAESRFRIGGELNHAWSMDVGDAVGTVGFAGRPSLEAVVIAPYSGNLEAAWRNPLATLKTLQGFVLPRDLRDIAGLAPGTSMALRGAGNLGFNLGVGLPITVGTLAEYVTLSARISAGARLNISGQLDVQLVRGAGQLAYVDVGLTNHQVKHFELALNTGWGIAGLPTLELELGPVHVDVVEIAKNALEKQLREKIETLTARASTSRQDTRLTVARFAFDVNGGAEVEQALHQAMRGDLRLAQALANRPATGVSQMLDLAKEAHNESSYLGFRFLGMHFYTQSGLDTGTVTIDQADQQQTLLFNEIDRRGGLFFTDRGTRWRQLTSLTAADGRLVDAAVNARLTMTESDRFLTKDQILDHADPLLAWLVGFDGLFEKVNGPADALFEYADHHCGYPPHATDEDADDEIEAYEQCVAALPADAAWQAFFGQSRDAYEGLSLRGDFDASFAAAAEVGRALLEMKLGISGIHDQPNASLDGPKGAMLAQLRFSHAALDEMLGAADAADRFRASLSGVLGLMKADRDDDLDEKVDEYGDLVRDKRRLINAASAAFAKHAARYQQFDRVSALELGGDRLGEHGHLLLVDPDRPADARLATLAEHKGRVVADLFADVAEETQVWGEPDDFVLGYALLWLTRPDQVEMLVDFQFDDDHEGGYTRFDTRLYSRGIESFIDAGLFNLDQLLGAR